MISNVLFNLEANYCGQKLIILSFYNRQLPCSRIKVVCSKQGFILCMYNTTKEHYMSLNVRKPVFGGYEQQRRRPAYASAQSDQHHCYLLFGKYHV